MLQIYIVRHGQDEDNANSILNGHRDCPLTEYGEKQALELAKNIKAKGLIFDAVYTSSLLRSRKTAEIICKTIDSKSPRTLDLLIERDFGTMTGQKLSDIERLCSPHIIKTGKVTYFLSPENGETFPQLLARANNVLEYVSSKHQSGNILLVTHGDIGKMIYASHNNIPWREMLTRFYFNNCDLLSLNQPK